MSAVDNLKDRVSVGVSPRLVVSFCFSFIALPFAVSHSAEGLPSLVRQMKSIEGENCAVMEHTVRYYESVEMKQGFMSVWSIHL